jgi:type II secretory pathway pseudopilin PulG
MGEMAVSEGIGARGSGFQRGFGMLEVGLALVVVAFAAAGLSKMLTSNVAATKAKSNAERLSMVTLAADQYLTQNEAQLKSVLAAGGAAIAIPVGKTCAGCAIPTGPSGLPSVQGDGLLSTAYVDLNNNQQSHALIVKELASGDLDAIVTTYGGSAIDDENLGYITGLIGAAAGGVYTNAAIAPTNQISGAHGGWGDATSNWNASIGGTSVRPTSGHVQVSLSLAQASGMGAIDPDDVLFRTSNGNATRNTMATDLSLGDNDIVDVVDVYARAFFDITPGQESYSLNPGGSSRLNRVQAGGIVSGATLESIPSRVPGVIYAPAFFDVNGRDADGPGSYPYRVDPANMNSRVRKLTVGDVATTNAVIHSDGTITSQRNITARAYYDGSEPSKSYILNPSSETRIERLIVGDDPFNVKVEIDGGHVRADYNFYGLAFYDQSYPGVNYNANPSHLSRFNRLRVGDPNDPANDIILRNNGTIHMDNDITASAYYYTSDERLKENIQDLDGWSVLKDLSPKSYRYKKDGRESMGLIAQEVEEILPHLVQEDEDGMKSVSYMDLIGPLIDVVQDLYTENKRLAEGMRFLESKIAE